MPAETAYLSIIDLIGHYQRRSLSPVEVVDAAFRRLHALQPKINAFCHIGEAEARAAARDAETRWRAGRPQGLLDGVPISVKDTIFAKGWPTLRGSRTVDPNQPWTEDSPAVARAREHGAIILGKTTTPEFGWKGVTDSPLTGTTRSPWNLEVTCGGSSGGSAAALAAGIGAAAIGTDAGGSVRIPSGFCGVVGLKPTSGRVANYPAGSGGTLGHIGPMAHTVADVAVMMNVIAKPDPRDWLCLPLANVDYRERLDAGIRGRRVAFSPTLGYAKVDPEVAAHVARAARAFADLGAEVEEVAAPFPDPSDCFRTHFFAGVSHACRAIPEDRRRLMDPGILRAIESGAKVTLTDYMAAADQRAALGRTMRLFHERYDLLLTPTLAVPAFAVNRVAPEGYDQRDWLSWTPFTYPFNLTGQPAASVPCGFTSTGLPVGLQIVGPMYGDADVLKAASAYQAAHSLTDRHPALD
jgi:aspartyl-tRNA(Asn)/glutamyl-tRNA(Gln) amidotransferase subunit A